MACPRRSCRVPVRGRADSLFLRLGSRRLLCPSRGRSGLRPCHARNGLWEWEQQRSAPWRTTAGAASSAFPVQLGPEGAIVAQVSLGLFAGLRFAEGVALVLVLLQEREQLAIGIAARQRGEVAVAKGVFGEDESLFS